MTRRSFGQVFRKGPKPAEGEVDLRPWFARFVDPRAPRTGQRARYIVRRVESEREGRKWLAAVRKAILAGVYQSPLSREEKAASGLTVAGALEEYIQAKRGEGAAESTLKHYGAFAGRVARSRLGARLAAEVTARDVEVFLRARAEDRTLGGRPLAPATLGLDLAVLGAAFARLVRLGTVARNPCEGIRRPKVTQGNRVALTAEEARALVRASGPSLRPMVLTALATGMRLSELAVLRWGDLVLTPAGGIARIHRRKNRTAAAVPLHPGAVAELLALRARVAAASGVPSALSLVFPSPSGTVRRSPPKAWRKALRLAGLADRPGICFHSLRHTFASQFLAAGGALQDLRGILGHSSVAITEKYLHDDPVRAREGVLRLALPGFEEDPEREGLHTLCVPATGTDGLPALPVEAAAAPNLLPRMGDTAASPPARAAG